MLNELRLSKTFYSIAKLTQILCFLEVPFLSLGILSDTQNLIVLSFV
jgi:hypothetical protein